MVQSGYFEGMYVEHHQLFDDRPTLVFLHDSLGCVHLWRDFPAQLANATQCNILLYDRIGYGKSEPMESWLRPVNYMELETHILIKLLNAYQIKKAILFGHSDGGTIALLAASLYPQHIAITIVEAAHIFVEGITLKGVREAIVAYETTNLKSRLEKYHSDKVDTLFKAWTQTWIREDYRDWNIEALLSNIQSPLLFIQGENDEYGSLAQVNDTISKPKGIATSFIISNVGHTPHKDVPERVLARCAEFILKQL